MCSGRRAFPGDHSLTTLGAVIHKDPDPLQAPPDIVRIVTRCLRKPPSERFETVADLRTALETARLEPAAVRQTGSSPANEPASPSIAVLPFANMSLDKEQEFFSGGLAEEILNLLAKIPELKVIARTSSFAFRGKDQDITRIAETLRVQTILEGSVRRSGNRIRVTAQLIEASDCSHLWSERYDRQLTDVFEMQDEIAAAIAGALRVRFVGGTTRKYQPKLPAYEALLQGRHEFSKFSPEGFERCREYLKRAVALDPEYAEPHALLEVCCYNLANHDLRAPREVMPLARASAAHDVLCYVAATYEFDWREAEKQCRLVVDSSGPTPLYASLSLLFLGRFDEAVRETEAALAQDPLNAVARIALLASLCWAGLYGRAIEEARKATEIIGEHYWVHFHHGWAYACSGKFVEAREPLEKALQLTPWQWTIMGTLAGVLACLGEKGRAELFAASIPESAPIGWATYHLLCSNIEAAADWYEKAIEQRHPTVAIWARAPFFKPLREIPRWPKLAQMMNLP